VKELCRWNLYSWSPRIESEEREHCGGVESGQKEFLMEEWCVEKGCSLLIFILENRISDDLVFRLQ
jgi:hypothetical protein